MNSKPFIISRYSDIKTLINDNKDSIHPGLLFERFPIIFKNVKNKPDTLDQKRSERLDNFLKLWNSSFTETSNRLSHFHKRMDCLVENLRGQERKYITGSRLAIGLGNTDASDIGFYFDPALGIPSIPGSSVKGLALAGAKLTGESEDIINLYFGYQQKEDEPETNASIGNVVFLNALPSEIPGFDKDIITCHHNYEKLITQKTPLDSDKPIPIHFLTVKAGTFFTFRLLLRPHAQKVQLEKVWNWLTLALEFLGAGGKTAVGYGVMLPSEKADLVLSLIAGNSDEKEQGLQFNRGDKIKVKRIKDPKGKNREIFQLPNNFRGSIKEGSTNTKVGDEVELYVYTKNDAQKVVTLSIDPVKSSK
ncbi:type III-B CRISPR module RAMP protein Cmr6 [bacterium]|nr:type III-B CRISPR module RAMP protein Cmr6 [bacterium]